MRHKVVNISEVFFIALTFFWSFIDLFFKLFILYWSITMLWWLQVHNKGTHPCIYRYLLSSKLPSHPGGHIKLSRVPCAICRRALLVFHFKYSSAYMLTESFKSLYILCLLPGHPSFKVLSFPPGPELLPVLSVLYFFISIYYTQHHVFTFCCVHLHL